MKKYNILSALILGVMLSTTTPVHAADACRTVLCMWGKLKGKDQNECRSDVDYYFSIIKKKKHKIKWDQTSSARQEFLDSCPKADRGKTKQINDRFGKSTG